jgi:hypothetical protein
VGEKKRMKTKKRRKKMMMKRQRKKVGEDVQEGTGNQGEGGVG